MAKITLHYPRDSSGKKPKTASFDASPAISVLVAAWKEGHALRHDCGGRAQCGTCRVQLLSGRMSPMGEKERQKLDELGAGKTERLACQARAGSDLELKAVFPVSVKSF
ncbi:hypothetical protein MASR2M29_05180 [Spirochaetota bacterium]